MPTPISQGVESEQQEWLPYPPPSLWHEEKLKLNRSTWAWLLTCLCRLQRAPTLWGPCLGILERQGHLPIGPL